MVMGDSDGSGASFIHCSISERYMRFCRISRSRGRTPTNVAIPYNNNSLFSLCASFSMSQMGVVCLSSTVLSLSDTCASVGSPGHVDARQQTLLFPTTTTHCSVFAHGNGGLRWEWCIFHPLLYL